MLAMKAPSFKENKDWKMPRACTICGFEISDEFHSKRDKNLCPECGKDVCFKDRKHQVKDGICLTCGVPIESQESFQRWINTKLPFCDAKIQKVDD
jgi:predicted RNA-binding Zn-ribbon protein involved in translation (DUF1610 family)